MFGVLEPLRDAVVGLVAVGDVVAAVLFWITPLVGSRENGATRPARVRRQSAVAANRACDGPCANSVSGIAMPARPEVAELLEKGEASTEAVGRSAWTNDTAVIAPR